MSEKDANKNKYAVAGLVVLGWDDALAFTQAADETGIPIILQAGPSCRAYTPVPILGKMFRYLADQTKTHICCHIDHGYTIRECIEGIDSGFTSVMLVFLTNAFLPNFSVILTTLPFNNSPPFLLTLCKVFSNCLLLAVSFKCVIFC